MESFTFPFGIFDCQMLLLQDVPYRSSLIRCLSIGTQPNIPSVILSLSFWICNARKRTWCSKHLELFWREEVCRPAGSRRHLFSRSSFRNWNAVRHWPQRSKIFKWAICRAISYNKMRQCLKIESEKKYSTKNESVIIQSEGIPSWFWLSSQDEWWFAIPELKSMHDDVVICLHKNVE